MPLVITWLNKQIKFRISSDINITKHSWKQQNNCKHKQQETAAFKLKLLLQLIIFLRSTVPRCKSLFTKTIWYRYTHQNRPYTYMQYIYIYIAYMYIYTHLLKMHIIYIIQYKSALIEKHMLCMCVSNHE